MAVIVVAAGRPRDPLTVGVVVAVGGGGQPMAAAVVIAVLGARRAVGDPAVVGVVVAVRRPFDPSALAVVVAARLGLFDRVDVPRAVAVVVAIGVCAVLARPGELVADDRAAGGACQRPFGPIVSSGQGAAHDRADAGAGDRAGHAIVALLLAGWLSRHKRGYQGRSGDAGDQR